MRVTILGCALAVMLAQGAYAQTAKTEQLVQEKSKQLFAEDVAAYVNEESYSLPWAVLPEKDVLWKKRVLRTIDMNDAPNRALGVGKPLVNVLLEGALAGKIKAYDAVDDRFTKLLSKEEVVGTMAPGKGKAAVKPSAITKYMIKEDWLFTKEGKMIVRILGIAPITEAGMPLFWVYFPHSREYLAQVSADGTKNWDKTLSDHDLSSKIDKVFSQD